MYSSTSKLKVRFELRVKRSGAVLLGPVDEKCRRSKYELQLFSSLFPINPIQAPFFFCPSVIFPPSIASPQRRQKSVQQSLRLIAGTSPPGTAPTAFVPCLVAIQASLTGIVRRRQVLRRRWPPPALNQTVCSFKPLLVRLDAP